MEILEKIGGLVTSILAVIFFSFKNAKKNTAQEEEHPVYGLGAIVTENDVDNRDIEMATVQAPQALPVSYITDISAIPVFNQGQLGTCVAHSFATTKMYLDFIENKKLNIYSRRFIYVLGRRYMNTVNTDDVINQGLYPRQTAKILSTLGSIIDRGDDDNNLSHSKYVDNYIITSDMKNEAIKYRAGKFVTVFNDAESIKQAIFATKIVPATIRIDWSCIESDGTTHAPKRTVGLHNVVLYGWENGKILYRNSWGESWGNKGNGSIPENEVEQVIFDAISFMDVPDSLIERAKNMQYIFTTDMKVGSKGNAVTQLQKRLISYGLLQRNEPTGTYGKETEWAVRDFQKIKGIQITGQIGPITRKALNDETPQGQTKSKIDLWCEAIERMEGANKKNNNPGNIRYIGQKTAIGKSYNGFCIFPDYATGYKELRDMLVRACTGKSKIYDPEGSLLDFFKLYAPAWDNNHPESYARFVANWMMVDINSKIKTFV